MAVVALLLVLAGGLLTQWLADRWAAASLVAFIMGAGLFGSTYLLPLFVQTIQGLTSTEAGLLLMPSGFALVLVFPIAGRLSDRFPAGLLIGGGMALFAYSSYLTGAIKINTGFWTIAWWTVLSRVGLDSYFRHSRQVRSGFCRTPLSPRGQAL